MKRFAAGQACGETFVKFVLFNGSQSLVRILSQTRGTVEVHNPDINDGSGAMLEQASDAHITSQMAVKSLVQLSLLNVRLVLANF